MGYWKNDEPVGNTCPLIDKVIAFIKDTTEESDNVADRIFGRCEHTNALNALEEIREANSSLREWGSNHSRTVSDLEQELEDLKNTSEDTIDKLEKEVESLKEQLQSAIDELNTIQQ